MDAIASNVIRVQEVVQKLEIIRRAANRYHIDIDPGSLNDMKVAEAQAAELLVDFSQGDTVGGASQAVQRHR